MEEFLDWRSHYCFTPRSKVLLSLFPDVECGVENVHNVFTECIQPEMPLAISLLNLQSMYGVKVWYCVALLNLHDLKEGRFQSSGTRHEPASRCGSYNLRENTARRAYWKHARKGLPSECFVAVTTDQQARPPNQIMTGVHALSYLVA